MIDFKRGLLTVAIGLGAHLTFADDTRTVTIFEGRQFSIPVPPKWSFDEKTEPQHGFQTIQLEDPGKEVVLQMTFIPDPSGKISSREAVEAEVRRLLDPLVESSVEKEIRLTIFDAPDGIGAYTTFTDGKLDPKHIPADEKLIAVSGIRTWKGGYTLFSVLINSKETPVYKTALEIAVSGTRQTKAPVAF